MEGTTNPAVPPTLVLRRFAATWCSMCTAMKKAMTLEKWLPSHPNIRLEEYDLDNPSAETLADGYGIEGVPAFVVLDSEGNTVLVEEGQLTSVGLDKLYARTLKVLEEGNLGAVKRKRKRGGARP